MFGEENYVLWFTHKSIDILINDKRPVLAKVSKHGQIKTRVTRVSVLKRGTDRGRCRHFLGNRVGNQIPLDIDSSSR